MLTRPKCHLHTPLPEAKQKKQERLAQVAFDRLLLEEEIKVIACVAVERDEGECPGGRYKGPFGSPLSVFRTFLMSHQHTTLHDSLQAGKNPKIASKGHQGNNRKGKKAD